MSESKKKIIIALPVYNEARVLKKNVEIVADFCRRQMTEFICVIVIVDNASTDETGQIGRELAHDFNSVEYLFLNQKGKGLAIRSAWEKYDGDIYVFMDIDLATDLKSLPLAVSAILSGYNIAIGSRFHKDSITDRSFPRKVISYGYRIFFKLMLNIKINDTACGFKAIDGVIKKELMPKVIENGFFFDSELVILAEKAGYKIKEIPVMWVENRIPGRKSTVNIWGTTRRYLKGMWGLRRRIKQEIKKSKNQ